MKQSIILLFSICFFISCKKDMTSTVRNQVTGEWEYISFGGYPFNHPTYPAGNGQIIVIGKDGSFERRAHDTTLFKGSYKLEERKDCYGDEKYVFFRTTDSSFVDNYSISVTRDTLYISSPNCLQDGGTSSWRKL